MRRALLAVLLLACGGAAGPLGDPEHGVELVSAEGVVEFHEHALAFYLRLRGRRFDTYATYRDDTLRGYFRDHDQYVDYYAELAQALDDAHFDKNRPLRAEIDEFLFDGPGRARVRFRMLGNNDLPLRWGSVGLEREDHWERREGRWWIVPAKL